MDAATERARRHLHAIAEAPRPAGGPAAQRAMAYCAGVLSDAGFSVRDVPFAYSAFPGRWATPLGGALMFVTVLAACVLSAAGRPGLALLTLVAFAAALAIGGRWLARDGVVDFPWLRESAVNLVAMRGDEDPAVWLVGHIDTKSQPIPTLVRVLGILVLALAALGTAVVTALEWAGVAVPGAAWSAAVWGALAGAIPVAASVVGARSVGALDNASGTAAVLLAAERLPKDLAVGVLITDAEELGMAGARAWARGRRPAVAFNCDGVDDVGILTVMHSGPRPRSADALEQAARDAGREVRVRRMLPGLLTDSVALAAAGWDSVTLSRGTLRTLGRVHSARDDLQRLLGQGIPEAATLMAAAVTDFR